ncbi:RsmB/NOP family class I SAM-dependent RNA methyltransferase [Chelatococcus sp. SYSU_G07232]|uniref:RsmB/NOP family class I SAM-dependent RNA methyltransferase n=1 Tax=Chelatococcus albus TaxID=3047466 RepID=A0ABT7ALD3_9HYPH|nr:RsmB/NOP family class I SAM-dependent RNA methyltransferase [Chelatococcus sp. SYSU_G07232]MDJ1159772.1 RsmB/NOP family class I SAM-dependent RNA methyltransferase [Chelatococcus sp. SYSU_G07232]
MLNTQPPPRRARPKAARRPADPPGLVARRIAVEALAAVLQRHAPLDETLDHLLAAATDLPERDRALARAVATAACRHLGTIRATLAARLAKGLPRNAGALEAILVAGAAQILLLDVPDHAAVDLSVQLAKADARAFPYAKLVNAVLRRVADDPTARAMPGTPASAADTPRWLYERWAAAYGATAAQAIAAAHACEPAVDVTVKADASAWAERLGGLLLPTGSIRLRERRPIPELPGYAEGAWWVQDAAAALPVRLLSPRPGERIADLCAAPGGKTAQLAAAAARVLAVDRSPERLARLEANMRRLGLTVETLAADLLALDGEPFDAVLLDAPCSATGTIRRHPDVAWTKREADITALATLQAKLLDKAASLVRPGGRLVYCTCSLEPEEGERQIESFLMRTPAFERQAVTAAEIGGLAEAITLHGELRTLPCHLPHAEPRLAGLDGFFAARLRRVW